MKMRSWSSSPGIMLVPSTFTGWYRKMMMKAEMASEITRSRTHAESKGRPQVGGGGRAVQVLGLSWHEQISILLRIGKGDGKLAFSFRGATGFAPTCVFLRRKTR